MQKYRVVSRQKIVGFCVSLGKRRERIKTLFSDAFATVKDFFVSMCANPPCRNTELIENHPVMEKGSHLHSD